MSQLLSPQSYFLSSNRKQGFSIYNQIENISSSKRSCGTNRSEYYLRCHSLDNSLKISRGFRSFRIQSTVDMVSLVKNQTTENNIIVYSKTWCPYCSQVKQLLNAYNVDYKVVELDKIGDGADIQAALLNVTGCRTVPQVFINGKFIGGCDDTMVAHNSGELQKLIEIS